jgi:hypothetical protein
VYRGSVRLQINFEEVLYQSIAGHWQLFGLSVQPEPQIASGAASSSAKKATGSAVKKK